tara:strand:- start:206 stop:1411 length:1206 start_codon:yes stop_codon:yes gene_type:complete
MESLLKVIDTNSSTKKQMLNKVTADLQKLGLVAPASDSDQRSQKVWKVLEDHSGPFSVAVDPQFDYTLLMPTDHEDIDFFQVRDNSQLSKRVSELIEKFYGPDSEPLKRAPIIIKYIGEDGNMIHGAIVGNGRGYCFKKKKDKKPAIIVDCTEMSPSDVYTLAFNGASRSNEDDNDSVDKEVFKDFVQQCLTYIKTLEKKRGPISFEDKKKSMYEFLSGKYALSRESSKPYINNIINFALKDGRSASLPTPSDVEIDSVWKSFWNGQSFDINKNDTVLKIKNNGYFDDMKRTILKEWLDRVPDEVTKVRKPCWLAIRIGSSESEKPITSHDKIKTERKRMIGLFNGFNSNPNCKLGGVHIVKKILFLKQLVSEADYEAWEWDEDMEQFVRVGSPSQISLDF